MAGFTQMQYNRYIRNMDTLEEHKFVEQQIVREMEIVSRFFKQYLQEHGSSDYEDILDAMFSMFDPRYGSSDYYDMLAMFEDNPEDRKVIDDVDIILQYVLNMPDLFVVHGGMPYNGKTVYQPNRVQIDLVGAV